MEKTVKNGVHALIAYDDARASAPYEHCIAAAIGVGLVLCALRADGRGRAVLHATLAGAMLARAAAGTDGLRKWADVPRPAAR